MKTLKGIREGIRRFVTVPHGNVNDFGACFIDLHGGFRQFPEPDIFRQRHVRQNGKQSAEHGVGIT